MVRSNTPTGYFILYASKNKTEVIGRAMLEKTKNLVDLMKYRAGNEGVFNAIHSLVEEAFELRMAFWKFLAADDHIFDELDKTLWEFAWETINADTKHQGLKESMSISLNAYSKLMASMSRDVENVASHVKDGTTDFGEMPGYHDFKIAISSFPIGKALKTQIDFVDTSLHFENALILSDLVMNEEVKISKSEVSNLTKFLLNTTEDYLYHAALLDLFVPEDEDESQMIRNVKIRLAAHQVNNAPNQAISTSEFQSLISA